LDVDTEIREKISDSSRADFSQNEARRPVELEESSGSCLFSGTELARRAQGCWPNRLRFQEFNLTQKACQILKYKNDIL
jgi:hypothetical protein